jgi:hypothetical protein
MSARIVNCETILDPWLNEEPDEVKRLAVINALFNAATNFGDLYAQPAVYGHPLRRLIEVPEAEVTILVVLPNPFLGIVLMRIDSI